MKPNVRFKSGIITAILNVPEKNNVYNYFAEKEKFLHNKGTNAYNEITLYEDEKTRGGKNSRKKTSKNKANAGNLL